MNGATGDRGIVTALSEPLNDVGVNYVAALADIGVVAGPPNGYVTPERGSRYARIGFVIWFDSGVVVAAHCVDATAPQVLSVFQQAQIAKRDGVDGPQWNRVQSGWECSILEPVAGTPPRTPRCSHVGRR